MALRLMSFKFPIGVEPTPAPEEMAEYDEAGPVQRALEERGWRGVCNEGSGPEWWCSYDAADHVAHGEGRGCDAHGHVAHGDEGCRPFE